MAVPESSPELSVVAEQDSEFEGVANEPNNFSAAREEPATPEEPSRRSWLWVAAGLLGGLGLVLALQQYQRAEQLETQVESLSVSLAESNRLLVEADRSLSAYRTRFEKVRVGVDEAADRLNTLRALVAGDPLEPVISEAPSRAAAPAAD